MSRTPFEVGSRKWLIHQLDILTSRIVRARDRRCVTCDKYQNLQCSHFYSRRYLIIRFDLRNCNAMCTGCNKRHNYDPFPYMEYMQEHYGPEVVGELHELRMSLEKVPDEDLREMFESYQRMV
ncbi:MAG: recombination protein NinG [Acidobacteriota bacterium]|nr:recombination protein NinG [Acidobacteriota bacterium]